MRPRERSAVVGIEHERVFEVDPDGEIARQWNASEYYDPPGDPTREDWLHMNDVDRIEEGRYLVSVRNENQLLILDRGEGVVDVINEDGNPDVLDEQHNPQWLGGGRVLVSDSGNDRVVELRERNGTWAVEWKLTSAGGYFSWPRDADLLENGNVLVTDSLNDRVVEVNRSGEVVWSISPGKVPYEADRLPGGEYPDGLLDERESTNTTAKEATPGGTGREDLPVITTVFSAVTGTLPLPYWVNQWHLVGFVLTVLVSAVGTVHDVRGE